ncbi:MAG: type II toxin-antitoxin system PemK/MazF family toxin [Candidatus Promineifilaceae bacterium]
MKAIKRGEIYFVNLNPVKGREQAGHRPVLVLSVDSINRLPLVITVVVGTKGENISRDYQTNVRVSVEESGLSIETVFLCFQVRSLDAKRFPQQPAGKLSNEAMNRIEDAVRYSLGL